MKRRTVLGIIAVSAWVLIAVIVWFSMTELGTVARVNGRAISRREFYGALEERGGREVLTQLINDELVRQAAAKDGVKISAQDIDEEVAEVKKRFPSDAAFETTLLQYNLTLEQFRAQIKSKLLMDALATKEVKFTEEDVKKYYGDHKADYKEPEQVRARHILLSKEEDAKQVLAKMKEGRDFIEIARESSTDTQTKGNGGDLGYFTRGTMSAEFDKVAFSLPVGEVSGVVKTPYGFHIIRVEDHKAERQPTLDEVRAKVEKAVKLEKAKPSYEVLAEIKSRSNVKINDREYKGLF